MAANGSKAARDEVMVTRYGHICSGEGKDWCGEVHANALEAAVHSFEENERLGTKRVPMVGGLIMAGGAQSAFVNEAFATTCRETYERYTSSPCFRDPATRGAFLSEQLADDARLGRTAAARFFISSDECCSLLDRPPKGASVVLPRSMPMTGYVCHGLDHGLCGLVHESLREANFCVLEARRVDPKCRRNVLRGARGPRSGRIAFDQRSMIAVDNERIGDPILGVVMSDRERHRRLRAELEPFIVERIESAHRPKVKAKRSARSSRKTTRAPRAA